MCQHPQNHRGPTTRPLHRMHSSNRSPREINDLFRPTVGKHLKLVGNSQDIEETVARHTRNMINCPSKARCNVVRLLLHSVRCCCCCPKICCRVQQLCFIIGVVQCIHCGGSQLLTSCQARPGCLSMGLARVLLSMSCCAIICLMSA